MLSLRCTSPRSAFLWRKSGATVLWRVPQRNNTFDPTRKMVGEREVVGHGINGSPTYNDCPDFPFPAIRFREVTPEICALREKEQGDWKKLSCQEKKTLYRHSFCQTFAEFQKFTGQWKEAVGIALWAVALAFGFSMLYNQSLSPITPESYDEDRRQSQLRRMIQLENEPITGISSKWDYAANKFK